jgi:predicted nucleic acid-binding protein
MNKAISNARRLYIDSNIVIYFIEAHEETRVHIRRLFSYVNEHDIRLVTSEATVGECLYGARKRQHAELVGRYADLFNDTDALELVPVERETFEQAAEIGAPRNLKLLDAVHVATALCEGCDVFVTNDKGIKSTDELKVVQLLDL